MAASEGKVCRAVIDRHDVMKYQLTEALKELLRAAVSTEIQQGVNERIEGVFSVHTDGLVGNISKQFSER